MAAPGGLKTLVRHVAALGQEINAGMRIVLATVRVRFHLIERLRQPFSKSEITLDQISSALELHDCIACSFASSGK